MKDLYKILGVARDATKETIKKIYRSKVKNYHPDTNDENLRERFEEITEAYKLLSDDRKRHEYDTTGEVKKEQDKEKTIITELIRLFKECLRQYNPEQDNIFDIMTAKIEDKVYKSEKEIHKIEKGIEQMTSLIKRVTGTNNKKDNIFVYAIEQDITGGRKAIETQEKQITLLKSMYDFMGDFEYNVDRNFDNDGYLHLKAPGSDATNFGG